MSTTTFIDRLVRAARYAGVGESQSDIARSLEVSRQRVNRWFHHGAEPDADQTLEIAKRWKINPDWLKNGNGDMLPVVGDGLSLEERDLIRNYRSATPQVRQVISTMARAVRKSVVTFALAIPPLLAPDPVSAAVLHNQKHGSVAYVITIAWRRLCRRISELAWACALGHGALRISDRR